MSRHQAARPLAPWAWLLLPAVLCVAATLIFGTPLKVLGLRLPEPVFFMVLPFAWAMIRPSVLGPLVLLVSGLFLDLYSGAPLGLWAFCLLLVYGGVVFARQLMAGAGPGGLCAWYLGWTAAAFGSAYLVLMFSAHVKPDLVAVGFQFVATAVLFPLSYRLIEVFEDADPRFR